MNRIRQKIHIVISVILILFSFSGYDIRQKEDSDYQILFSGNVLNFAVSKSDPDIIFVCRLDGNDKSLYKTSDGGRNWNKIESINRFRKIEIDDLNPDIVYVAPDG
ncbi:WD40/YVTN/BNR-like repeat-containing protein [candidate division KSB1 bacterium]